MQNFCEKIESEVMTHKSGKFILSGKCDYMEVMPLLVEADVLYRTIKDLPILPDMASHLDKDVVRRSIHGTAAIEGNPLNEEEVNEILLEPEDVISSDMATMEIRNLKRAYDDLMEKGDKEGKPFLLTEEFIKTVHKIITLNISHTANEPGVYRNYRVEVGDKEHGGKYIPPKILVDIKNIMNHFIAWINSDSLINEIHPFIRAAMAHYHIGIIHPFGDGNGRTGRFIEAAVLTWSGYKYIPKMLSNFYYKNVDDYYIAFRLAEKSKEGNITPFIKFVLMGIISSLEELKKHITFHIRHLALRDYYKWARYNRIITQRQYDLLNILLDRVEPFSKRELYTTSPFNILYRKVSEDTARRDLKKLKELKYLIKEGNLYHLNLEGLG